jgi:hypothetical protein
MESYNFLRTCQAIFQEWLYNVRILATVHKGFDFSTFLPTFNKFYELFLLHPF